MQKMAKKMGVFEDDGDDVHGIEIQYHVDDGDDVDVPPMFDEVWRVYVHTKDMFETAAYQDRSFGDCAMPNNAPAISTGR